MDPNLTDVRTALENLGNIRRAPGFTAQYMREAVRALERIEARLTEREPSPGPMNAAEMIDDDRR